MYHINSKFAGDRNIFNTQNANFLECPRVPWIQETNVWQILLLEWLVITSYLCSSNVYCLMLLIINLVSSNINYILEQMTTFVP